MFFVKIKATNPVNFDECGRIINDDGNIITNYYNLGSWNKYNFIEVFLLENTIIDNNNYNIDDNVINKLMFYIRHDLDYIASLCIIDGNFNKDIYDNIEKYINSDILKLQTCHAYGDMIYDKYHIMVLQNILDYLNNSKEIEGKYYFRCI